jgi:hypothetical protein
LSTETAAGCRATDATSVVDAFAATVELLAPASVPLVPAVVSPVKVVFEGRTGRTKLENDDAAASVPFRTTGNAVV